MGETMEMRRVFNEGEFDKTCADQRDRDALARVGEGEDEDAQGAEGLAKDGEHESEETLLIHNAIARVFDDVRKQSAQSALVTSRRWCEIGLIPEGMSEEDLEMAVYEYLCAYYDEHGHPDVHETASFMGSAPPSGGVHTHTAPARTPSRFANRGVGSPTRFAEKMAAAKVHNEAMSKGDVDRDRSAYPSDQPGDPEKVCFGPSDQTNALCDEVAVKVEEERASVRAGCAFGESFAQSMEARCVTRQAELERAESEKERSTLEQSPFAGLQIPEGYTLEEIEGEWVLVETDVPVEVREITIDARGIEMLMGAHEYYLFDVNEMTTTYAHWAFLAAENNPLTTFVDCVREESRVYPRPMALSSLHNPPFRMNQDAVEAAYHEARKHADYADVKRIEASNSDVYFFSTKYLSETQARSLAEWEAVGRSMNV